MGGISTVGWDGTCSRVGRCDCVGGVPTGVGELDSGRWVVGQVKLSRPYVGPVGKEGLDPWVVEVCDAPEGE